jgi:hypothetical protein
MMMNDRPRWRRLPLGARVIGALLYVLTVTVTCSLIVLCVAGARFVILRYLLSDCGT